MVGTNVSDNVLDSILALDTTSRLRIHSRRIEGFIHAIPEDTKEEIHGLLDFAMEKMTKYRDILPQAETLNKLRTGKIRREKVRSRYISGEARVLSHKHVNEGLQRLKYLEEERVKRQRNAERRKQMAEEKKAAKLSLDAQWKHDIQHHYEVVIPGWKAACLEMDKEWNEAPKRLRGRGRKPAHPARPKRPTKQKLCPGDLTMVEEESEVGIDPGLNHAEEEEDAYEAEIITSLNAVEISHFC